MINQINNFCISIIIYCVATPVFIISSILLLLINIFNKNLTFISLRFFSKIILFLMGMSIKINGFFPDKKQYIVMMNHTSFIDMFLYPLIMRGKWTGITSSENFKYPLLSIILKKMDAIPIKKTNKIGAIKTIQIAENKISEGFHIGIMPEGARTLDGKMLELKKGGFHMAINTKAPILPIGVKGAFAAKPRNRWWIMPSKITINIGKPISVKSLTTKDIDFLLKKVKAELQFLSQNT